MEQGAAQNLVLPYFHDRRTVVPNDPLVGAHVILIAPVGNQNSQRFQREPNEIGIRTRGVIQFHVPLVVPNSGFPILIVGSENRNSQHLGDDLLALNSNQVIPFPLQEVQRNQRAVAAEVQWDLGAVAGAFVNHYYSMFDTNRAGLSDLYQEGSLLTFEGELFHGAQNIVPKIASLPLEQCQHSISTVDFQPSCPVGGILLSVSGYLHVSGEQHPLKFNQTFQLMPTPEGRFYVQNEIFRFDHA